MINYETFMKEKDRIAELPDEEQKRFYEKVLEEEKEDSSVKLRAYFQYAVLFYYEGNFRKAREILEASLEIAGASCTVYPDGEKLTEAFENVKPGEYDAILMDIQMPNRNGYEAARLIRSGENELGREIPIIAMTANAFVEDVNNSLAAGMNAHISKPLDMAVLESTMRRLKNTQKG